ncbi:YraN family protein [Marivirga sp. S37H4]|uniref:UPF0102 protein JKA74_10140 n=1 Tax=Marivirga aurantiaca TaxID=2802615 RepID=A0A934WZ02_9BACT|nr:YraN family protein [Marivirga aurantiaca]MBK6265396.1 YraN family protein [Marivirga aurantiaca]
MNTKKIGDLGEDIAATILEKAGYEILERNYRYKRSEIDLICLKDNLLVFVEVKALKSHHFGHPEERVNDHKVQKVMEAAEDYIFAINWKSDIRFDILSIDLRNHANYLHIKDAFY